MTEPISQLTSPPSSATSDPISDASSDPISSSSAPESLLDIQSDIRTILRDFTTAFIHRRRRKRADAYLIQKRVQVLERAHGRLFKRIKRYEDVHKALKEKLRVMKREMEKEEGLLGNKGLSEGVRPRAKMRPKWGSRAGGNGSGRMRKSKWKKGDGDGDVE